MLLNAFRGCMVGGLIGDCLGSPFEGQRRVSKQVNKFFDKLSSHDLDASAVAREKLQFTDDTAMTWDIAESLISKRQFDGVDIATRFYETYYKDRQRGYGGNVVNVFVKWKRQSELSDPFLAAREQFGGLGSYGNGGAMRISPVPLFAINDYDTLLTVTRESTLLTHTHPDGVCGALVQAVALWQVLKHTQLCVTSASPEVFDKVRFVDELIQRIGLIESATSGSAEGKTYVPMLNLVKKYISTDTDVTDVEIIENLGNNISASKSVPTSVYCFLKYVTTGGDQTASENGFERTVRYAVSLGGDTDTIASMAGSLAGAYYGIDRIPTYLKNPCENLEKALHIAEELYALVCK